MEIKQSNQFYYRVQEDDTMLKVFEKFNTCKDNIFRNNYDLDLYAGEWIIIKTNQFKIHYVKPLDKLSEISKKYDIEIEKLKNDNNLKTEKLFIGQMIKIFK